MNTRDLGAAIIAAIERGRVYVPEGWEVEHDCGPDVRLVSRSLGLATGWIGGEALTNVEIEGTPMSGQRARFAGQERVYSGHEAFIMLVEQIVITVGMTVSQMIKRAGERQHVGPRAVVVLEPYDEPEEIGATL